MAKKTITLKDNRPDLVADFTTWLESKKTSYGSENWFDFYDDDYYNYYDEYYGYEGYGCYPRQSASFPRVESVFPSDDDYGCRWDEEDDDEDAYANYWNKHAQKEKNKVSSTHKRGKRGSKKSQKRGEEDLLSDEEIDDILAQRKAIYFYDDITDETTVHKFKNLRKFFNYLEDNGIEISDAEGSKFIRTDVRHCCIDPLKLSTLNIKEIISDHSYGALSYEVSEDAALFKD